MSADFVISDGAPYHVPHRLTQSYPGGPTYPQIERLSLPYDGTINPSLLMGGDHTFPHHNQSPVDSYVSGDEHYLDMSPAPSTHTEVWMGYSDEGSVSGTSPTSPTVCNRVSAPPC